MADPELYEEYVEHVTRTIATRRRYLAAKAAMDPLVDDYADAIAGLQLWSMEVLKTHGKKAFSIDDQERVLRDAAQLLDMDYASDQLLAPYREGFAAARQQELAEIARFN